MTNRAYRIVVALAFLPVLGFTLFMAWRLAHGQMPMPRMVAVFLALGLGNGGLLAVNLLRPKRGAAAPTPRTVRRYAGN